MTSFAISTSFSKKKYEIKIIIVCKSSGTIYILWYDLRVLWTSKITAKSQAMPLGFWHQNRYWLLDYQISYFNSNAWLKRFQSYGPSNQKTYPELRFSWVYVSESLLFRQSRFNQPVQTLSTHSSKSNGLKLIFSGSF